MKSFLVVFGIVIANLPFMLSKCAPYDGVIDKKTKIKVFEFYALILAAAATFITIVNATAGISISIYKLTILAVGTLTTVVNILVIKNHTYEHLFIMGISGSCVYMSYTIVTFIQGKVIPMHDETLFVMINALASAIITIPQVPLFRRLLIKTVTPFFSFDAKSFWKQVWFIPETLLIVTFLAVPTDKFITSVSAVISRVLIMAVTLAICHSLSRENLNMREKFANEEQMARQQEYYLALSDSVTTMRKYRHDFKHHVAALNGFAKMGQFEEMKDYLRQMSITSDKETVVNYTGRASADGLIYHYASVADQENIDFTVKGTFKGISMADTDLCVLLGNALENALGGCRTINTGRFITVEIKKQGNLLAILVKNSFDGTVQENDGKVLSRKRNKTKGIGLSSMQEMCKKYNGTFETRYEGNVFCVFLMLDCVELDD